MSSHWFQPPSSQALPHDSIFIDTLHLSANIGSDCWHRSKAQPIGLSVYLLLPNGSLNIASLSDDVSDSVDYAELTTALMKFVEGYEPLTSTSNPAKPHPTLDAGDTATSSTPNDNRGSNSKINDFIDKLTLQIFSFLDTQQPTPSATLTTPLVQPHPAITSSDGALSASPTQNSLASIPTATKVQPAATAAGITPSLIQVRVVLHLPKFLLLSPHFSMEVITASPSSIGTPDQTRVVEVKDLDLPVIVGINSPERQMKQKVKTTIIFREVVDDPEGVDYQHLVAEIAKLIELSSYLTLERFVYQVAQYACTASSSFHSVTVRAHKPSAIGFAESSGVEITRSTRDFRDVIGDPSVLD